MSKTAKVNPLDVFDLRRVDFCPPFYNTVNIDPGYNLVNALDEWIYQNLSGRYYIGPCVDLDNDGNIKKRVKVGFETEREMSFFMLACPFLKYTK
jgi:hypothetical protein